MPDLFQNRRLIITPLADTDADAIAKLTTFWQRIGSSVSVMSVEHHDTVLTATSHLPHIRFIPTSPLPWMASIW
jgi:Prephenate dehydrogenase